MITFEQAITDMPLIAILRHLDVESAASIGHVLHDSGFRLIEVPLNDEPTALRCIEAIVDAVGDGAVVGAGTVTSSGQVHRVRDAGGRLIVSPDTNTDVIDAAIGAGLQSCPGVATPTEAFVALRAGANVLKLFPARLHGPAGLAGLRDVLPSSTRLIPVGGVSVDNAAEWRRSGAAGLGIGSSLYAPGASVAQVGEQASRFVAAWGSSRDET